MSLTKLSTFWNKTEMISLQGENINIFFLKYINSKGKKSNFIFLFKWSNLNLCLFVALPLKPALCVRERCCSFHYFSWTDLGALNWSIFTSIFKELISHLVTLKTTRKYLQSVILKNKRFWNVVQYYFPFITGNK